MFFDLSTETEVPRPSTYEIASGIPKCDGDRHEVLFPVFRHEHTIDDIMLLKNGSLAHRYNTSLFSNTRRSMVKCVFN